jgi:hypothetical protein
LYETYKFCVFPEENLDSYLQIVGHFARRIDDFIKRNPDGKANLKKIELSLHFQVEHIFRIKNIGSGLKNAEQERRHYRIFEKQ